MEIYFGRKERECREEIKGRRKERRWKLFIAGAMEEYVGGFESGETGKETITAIISNMGRKLFSSHTVSQKTRGLSTTNDSGACGLGACQNIKGIDMVKSWPNQVKNISVFVKFDTLIT